MLHALYLAKQEPGAEYVPDIDPEPLRLEYRDPRRRRFLPTPPT